MSVSESDADSIVLYLRSLPAVKNEIPERQDLGFPVQQAKPVPADMLPSTTLKASDPKYASAENGKYLAANVGICMECHTEHDPLGEVPLKLDQLFQGNEAFARAQLHLPPAFPETIYSSNITPGKKTNSANGKPNRKRTCVAPTVPSVAVNSRCIALRAVCAAAAISVKTAQSILSPRHARA